MTSEAAGSNAAGPIGEGSSVEPSRAEDPHAAGREDDPQEAAPTIDLASAWTELQLGIRRRIQPEQFETWFRRSSLTRLDPEVVCITVQNAFSRDWLKTYYADVLSSAVQELTGTSPRLEIDVNRELPIEERAEEAPPAEQRPPEKANSRYETGEHLNGRHAAAAESVRLPLSRSDRRRTSFEDDAPARRYGEASDDANNAAAARADGGRVHEARADSARAKGAPQRKSSPANDTDAGLGRDRLVRGSDIGLNPKYTFDNFVVGPCNRFAHAAAVGIAELPGRAYNPLFLHGCVGLGKTHLLQSISYTLLDEWEGVRILFLSCETFVNHFIGALENGDLQKFRNRYRNVDVLVVDDIHLLANKERTQEEFFHTFNTLYNAGKQIVLSSDSPPKDIPTLQERLVSRFKWGLVTELEPPCYETRVAILKRKSRERGLELPEAIAGLVAERVERNIRELEGAVNKLIGYATITNSEIDEDLLRRAMPELFTLRSTQPSTEEIFALVTEGFGVKLSELQSKRRTNAIAYPRQIAMYLARKLTRHSLEEIGGFFGGRDHSTVLYAVEKINKLMQSDEECRRVVTGFLDRLQAGSRS